jgi:16S rRNA processing protein RimM
MSKNNKIVIAKVISAFGIKGEVKIVCFCQNPLDIEKYSLFDEQGEQFKISISNKNKAVFKSSAAKDAILIVKIDKIFDRNEAEKIRNKEFFINKTDLKKTKKDEFYLADLIGLSVINKDKKEIGEVVDVHINGESGTLEIVFNSTFIKSKIGKELSSIATFPFKNEFFSEIDLAKNQITFIYPEVADERK